MLRIITFFVCFCVLTVAAPVFAAEIPAEKQKTPPSAQKTPQQTQDSQTPPKALAALLAKKELVAEFNGCYSDQGQGHIGCRFISPARQWNYDVVFDDDIDAEEIPRQQDDSLPLSPLSIKRFLMNENGRRIQVVSATPLELNIKARWVKPLAFLSDKRSRGLWAIHTLLRKNATTYGSL